MNDFLSWCKHLLVPFLFHDLTSLHPPSFRNLSIGSVAARRVHVIVPGTARLVPPVDVQKR